MGAPVTKAKSSKATARAKTFYCSNVRWASWRGILPWNFPFFLIARKMGPALVTGNTIVVKPNSVTPINCHIFAEIVDAVGLPAGVFNVVNGPGAEIGNALSAHPQVDMVSLTGSVNRPPE